MRRRTFLPSRYSYYRWRTLVYCKRNRLIEPLTTLSNSSSEIWSVPKFLRGARRGLSRPENCKNYSRRARKRFLPLNALGQTQQNSPPFSIRKNAPGHSDQVWRVGVCFLYGARIGERSFPFCHLCAPKWKPKVFDSYCRFGTDC